MTLTRKLLIAQSVILLGGAMIAWSALIPMMTNFYALYGTFWHFNDCIIPNPLTTACLYGSLAFLVALYWSLIVFQTPTPRSERYLRNFLLFCVIFGGSVLTLEAAQYYKFIATPISVSCNPGASPFGTPCFYGTIAYILAFITSIFATRYCALSSDSDAR